MFSFRSFKKMKFNQKLHNFECNFNRFPLLYVHILMLEENNKTKKIFEIPQVDHWCWCLTLIEEWNPTFFFK